MNILANFEYLKDLLESVDYRLTLTQEESDKVYGLLSIIEEAVKRKKEQVRQHQMEEGFIHMKQLMQDGKVKDAFEFFKKVHK